MPQHKREREREGGRGREEREYEGVPRSLGYPVIRDAAAQHGVVRHDFALVKYPHPAAGELVASDDLYIRKEITQCTNSTKQYIPQGNSSER
jgi:hypothetical protein